MLTWRALKSDSLIDQTFALTSWHFACSRTGELRGVEIPAEILSWVNTEMSADWNRIGLFLRGQSEQENPPTSSLVPWILEASRRYGTCDTNQDQRLRGTELDCYVDRVLRQTEETLQRFASSQTEFAILRPLFDMAKEGSLLRTIIKLATQNPDQLEQEMTRQVRPTAITSSPAKLMRILEESIRRSQPLCRQPDC